MNVTKEQFEQRTEKELFEIVKALAGNLNPYDFSDKDGKRGVRYGKKVIEFAIDVWTEYNNFRDDLEKNRGE